MPHLLSSNPCKEISVSIVQIRSIISNLHQYGYISFGLVETRSQDLEFLYQMFDNALYVVEYHFAQQCPYCKIWVLPTQRDKSSVKFSSITQSQNFTLSMFSAVCHLSHFTLAMNNVPHTCLRHFCHLRYLL